jgi:hypothetical protein
MQSCTVWEFIFVAITIDMVILCILLIADLGFFLSLSL